jgi:hypothetical protein
MERSNLTNKKAQIWGMDLIVAVLIFSLTLSIYYFYTINDRESTKENLDQLTHKGRLITEILLSQGTPTNWNEQQVTEIGLLTNGKINQTKIEQFYNLSTNNYEKTKQLFNSEYDYYFFLEEHIETPQGIIEGIGKTGINKTNIEARNLIKIERITIHKNKPTTATLYIWEN